MRPMNIIALGKEAQHVCLRYRIEPVRQAFRVQGHWFSVQQMPKTPWGRLALYRDIKNAHIVVVQRRLISSWELPLLRRAAQHLIFDFDDAFFQRNSYRPGRKSPRRLARFQAMVQAADQVFAGNEYLAECASQFTTPNKIVVMPTCVDASHYPMAQHQRRGPGVRMVWIGSSSTLRGLEQQAEFWNTLGRTLPGLELYVICDRFPKFPGIKVVPVPWIQKLEANQLAGCDIGIAHMPDDTWSKGKCGLKVLQYQAAGLPVVTTPVGVNRQLVHPEVNGFWASTPSEWVVAIGRLMNDPELRRQMGQAGRHQVEEHYSIEQLIYRWKSSLQRILQPKAVA